MVASSKAHCHSADYYIISYQGCAGTIASISTIFDAPNSDPICCQIGINEQMSHDAGGGQKLGKFIQNMGFFTIFSHDESNYLPIC